MTEDKKIEEKKDVIETSENTEVKTDDNQNDTTKNEEVENTESLDNTQDNSVDSKESRVEKKDFEKKPFKKNFRKSRKTFKREKPEFDQKILSLRRVTRVMAGGRRFSFSVAMVIGDKKGRVGVGLGKANDTTSAIKKAVRNAKKNMIKISLLENGSIPYDVNAKYKASKVVIRPVIGKGLAVGGAVRTVLEFAGIKEAGAKILSRSKNHFNNAKATIIALEPFSEKVVYIEKKINKTRKPFNKRRSFSEKKFDKKSTEKSTEKMTERKDVEKVEKENN